MTSKYSMVNVVWYDGCDAFVSKFILSNEQTGALKDIERYLYGNGEVLKLDYLYELNADNIIAILSSDESKYKCIADRFMRMYL